MQKHHIGFIGLGHIGSILAQNISSELNNNLIVWERTERRQLKNVIYVDKLDDLLSKVDIIFLCVTDHRTIFNLIIKNIHVFNQRKITIIDHSTCYYKSSITINRIAKKHNVTYIDMPFTGSTNLAKSKSITIFAGCDYLNITPHIYKLINSYSKRIIFFKEHGNGQKFKLINQTLMINNLVLSFEVNNLFKECNLDNYGNIRELLSDSFSYSQAFDLFTKCSDDDSLKITYIKNVYKDLKYIKRLASTNNQKILLSEESLKLIESMINDGYGNSTLHKINDYF
jgi:3-hydroxyisobutyrate dehydrogenase